MSDEPKQTRTIAPSVFLLTVGFAIVTFMAGAAPTVEGILTGTGKLLMFLIIMVPVTIAAMRVETLLKTR